ncbi:hypothetical protein HYPSUDRAFT_54889 [Hypholoma sublateritium FD-334 SS-4]|uniref:F-box domain-containing protein n=1 Tax=Hypholoma sublateritium (strain FD-334 SS-4) TaxID=945553 RepID=A0A0D2PRY6_HYPSF|nr:hypothetical protein HYPSUDRAFT_54889 [Hypholoma sublateritium FD-334 SS-4]
MARSMQWSYPERRSPDGKALSHIANEIYMHIVDYIKCHALGGLTNDPLVRRDLRSLSAVCRFFCAVTAPWLFQSICFDGLCPAGQSGASSFCRKLLAGDQAAQLMAQYVTKCEFLSWETVGKNSWTRKEFMSIGAQINENGDHERSIEGNNGIAETFETPGS